MTAVPVPQHCPTPRELDDLELLATGALAPITRFGEPGSPVTLTLPADLADEEVVELVDPEGLPLARLTTATGEVEVLTHHQYGAFRRLHLSPAQVREQYAGRTFVPVVDALDTAQLDELRGLGPLVLLALTGHGTAELTPTALLRASLAAAARLPDAAVVAVPLAAHDDPEADHELGVRVVATYAAGDPVHALTGPPVVEVRASASLETPGPDYPADIAAIVDADRPAPDEQGLVLFFTGLSGSGKSTLARALMDRILEETDRPVTSLDGDVVRRHLSKGLTFSKEDRETNIRRIGWVAAEISRHRGLAVCSPIAPFAETRAQVRQMVEDAGGAFFLVHVATPLEECERRDRKGLYAKARAGEIPEFTGISSPYEEPDDASVRVDTTGRTIEDALEDVIVALREEGYLELATSGEPAPVAEQRPLKVLFVCTANICRSPYMERVARSLDVPGVEFTSAGTHGFDAHPMDPPMASRLVERGLDGSDFRSRRVTPRLIAEADLVLTAEAAHRSAILEESPEAVRKVFTLGQAARLVAEQDSPMSPRELVEALAERRTPPDPADDVADPYGRGDEASVTAAEEIAALVRRVLGA
jgi:sulfate adenylyltransferase